MTRKHRGLTLLEMMVVLFIAGLALSLGFQSLRQWQRAEESLDRVGGSTRESMLSESWWRDSVRGINSQFGAKVEGDDQQFSATTATPVLASPATATRLSWSIDAGGDGLRLLLNEEDQTIALALPDTRDARFQYLDSKGKLHAVWPPLLGMQHAAPAAIALLQAGEDGVSRIWLSTIAGQPAPQDPAFELDPP